eukprot:TRINITY_DN3137_c0_g2_i1.p1 TRINITY_DN3137_c0_g2~~TRINITY_DN3137_c0_g2_i1.p1  ORF type:complete len:511 (+),score=57.64 TRINITY_DN3137_c0_g2_i1:695-2227(+)
MDQLNGQNLTLQSEIISLDIINTRFCSVNGSSLYNNIILSQVTNLTLSGEMDIYCCRGSDRPTLNDSLVLFSPQILILNINQETFSIQYVDYVPKKGTKPYDTNKFGYSGQETKPIPISCYASGFGILIDPSICPSQCTCENCYQSNNCSTCYPNWTGYNCYLKDCPGSPDCNNHGICSDPDPHRIFPYCSCSRGWSGDDCSVPICTNNCSGYGSCLSTTNPPTCKCDSTHLPPDCSIEVHICDGNPECSGNGLCNRSSGICSCDSSWTGRSCSIANCTTTCDFDQICTVIDGKAQCTTSSRPPSSPSTSSSSTISTSAPIRNSSNSTGSVERKCPGENGQCNSRGECKLIGSPQCDCDSGWSGVDCSIPYISCPFDEMNKTCSNRGICNTALGRCVCDNGWSDARCSTPVCTNCAVTGHCKIPNITESILRNSTQPYCACDDGWFGPDCSSGKCKDDCSGRGKCRTDIGLVCSCDVGWSGDSCTDKLRSNVEAAKHQLNKGALPLHDGR